MTAVGNCSRCNSLVEKGDLRCAVCGFTLPNDEAGASNTAAQIMRCEECSAAVTYDASAQAPRCAFCDSTMHVESIEDPLEQTELFLPFRAGPNDAKGTVKNWLGSLGFFRPSDLSSESRIESVKPLYWVGWVFRANSLVSWAADSNAGSGRSAWAPHSGTEHMVFESLVVSASRGLKEPECEFLTSSYDLASGHPAPNAPPGFIVEQFDVQRSQARAQISDAIRATAASRITQNCIPGSKFRKVQVEPLLEGLHTQRFAFPAYVMAYHYRNKPYRAVVSGHDAQKVTGTAPYSIAKIMLVIGIIAAVIAGIVVAVVVA